MHLELGMDAPRSHIPRLTTVKRRRRVALGFVGALAIGAVIVVAAVSGDSGVDVIAAATPSTAEVPATTPTTTPATTSTVTLTTVAPTTAVPLVTPPATTTTVAVTITTSAPATMAAPPQSSAAPQIAVAPNAPASTPASNCTDAGAISIDAIGVLQPILAETRQFADGLLCGNHRSDGVAEGVDILPGFASLDASAQGGDALIGQVPAVIFGHRKSHNRPFYKIDKLQSGQIVVIHRLDGSEIDLQVATVELHTLADATTLLLSPSADGAAQVRLVACSHGDGTPGGVNFRWIATLVPA